MKALIVDDDRTLADLLAFTLRREGFETFLAYDAPSAIRVFEKEMPDVMVVDVNMPGEPGLRNGFDVCRKVRQTSGVPIILLTVRDDEDDVVQGLSIGADDYVLKPFSPRQLVARIQTVLRRASAGRSHTIAPYMYENLQFDPQLRTVMRSGYEPVTLTRLEARLLGILMLNCGRVMTADQIIDHVWGAGGGNTEMLRQLVRRLRLKIEENPDEPELIMNLPGVGYGFAI
ncbi:MAG: response regulator transcription factor [Brevefilum sp.]